MPGIIGYIGNRSVSPRCVLCIEEDAVMRSAHKFGSWGVVYYQAGDILLRSHPFATGDVSGLLGVMKEAETTILLGRFESPAVRPPGRWNAQPFRYRGWVYVQDGRVEGFGKIREGLVMAMPDFLGRSLKGSSDAEVVFHLIMSFLHDAGKLDSTEVESQLFVGTMRNAVEFIRRLCSQQGAKEPAISFILSNGAMVGGYNSNPNALMAIYERRGWCERCDFVQHCKLQHSHDSPRAALVMIFRHVPEAFAHRPHFSPLPTDSFFLISQDVTFESVPGRLSVY